MKTSETITEISTALTKAWGDISNPKHNKKVTVRTKKGGSYNFEYTDLGGVIDGVKPHFKEHGISILQHAYTELIEGRSFISVVTKFLHSSGEWMESKPMQLPVTGTIQDMGGQITYMKRYSLSAMLGISTEEDDDANGSLGNQVTPQEPKQPPKQVEKGVVKAKFMTGGGTEDQFDEWYAKQTAGGFNHNQMDAYLTKRLADKK